MDEKLLELITPHLIKNSPNTYAYTKCLTEQLVNEYSKLLPIAIARPASGKFLLNFQHKAAKPKKNDGS